jgi:acetyl-CoA carboxylase biotin carboxyl carrier protein
MTEEKPKPKAEKSTGGGIDPALVEALADIVTRLGLSEIEVEKGDLKIKVARHVVAAAVPLAAMPTASLAPAVSVTPVAAALVAAAPEVESPGTIKSPMVGTAYLRPSPEAPPFVEIGAMVKAGDKIMLIEAMKTFNEIVAPRAGTVIGILVNDGQPVEYGQPLMVIE